MSVFRRAMGACPTCGKLRRADVPEAEHKAKTREINCKVCGDTFAIPVASEWWASWRDMHGRYRRMKIGSLSDARETENAERRASRRKESTFSSRYRFTEAVEEFTNIPNYKSDKMHMVRLIADRLGDPKIGSIGQPQISALKRGLLSDGYSSATVKTALQLVGITMRASHRAGVLRKSELDFSVHGARSAARSISVEQLESILAASPKKLRPVVLIAAAAPVTMEQIAKMRWGDVDTNRMTISVATDSGVVVYVYPVSLHGKILSTKGAKVDGVVFDGSVSYIGKMYRAARAISGVDVKFSDLKRVGAQSPVEISQLARCAGVDASVIAKAIADAISDAKKAA